MATTRHLSSADVAKELGCNTRQVSRLVTAGTLTPAVQAPGLRGAFLFDPTEVARVKRQQSRKTRPTRQRRAEGVRADLMVVDESGAVS